MPFTYERTVHFPDTDAAGVVFFARYFAIAHEAYEEALGAAGIDLAAFFSAQNVVVPIARAEADYLRPLRAGDRLRVTVSPTRLAPERFTLATEIHRLGPVAKLAARLVTEHLCITADTRQRTPLPADLAAWVDAG
jgi:1,4-dihydroxy-2-naphthoyl-CoA hydrolase